MILIVNINYLYSRKICASIILISCEWGTSKPKKIVIFPVNVKNSFVNGLCGSRGINHE